MHLSEKLDYFATMGPIHTDSDDMLTPEKESKLASFGLFSKYIGEVAVRMKQYKDELLSACLQLVLSVPKEFVVIEQLLAPLQTSLKLGLTDLDVRPPSASLT